MARQGLQRGFNQGILQGVKTGYAMGNHRTGFAGGITDGTANMDKMQDPVLLTGVKKPIIFCNADNITSTATTVTMTDLIQSGYTLNAAGGTTLTPDVVARDIFNLRNALEFNAATNYLTTTPIFPSTGYQEISIMMVVKLKAIAAQILYLEDTITPGGIDLQMSNSNRTIRSIYYGGQPGNMKNSQYDSFGSQVELEDYMILTAKYRLAQPGGPGSEQEVYINGTLRRQLFSSNFEVITTQMVANQELIIGNTVTSGGTRGNSMFLGAFLLTNYWLNESEQIRLENYFRDYYGHKF